MGSFLQVLGLMMTSLSTKYYQVLLAQGICTSIGMSAIYVPGNPPFFFFITPSFFINPKAHLTPPKQQPA